MKSAPTQSQRSLSLSLGIGAVAFIFSLCINTVLTTAHSSLGGMEQLFTFPFFFALFFITIGTSFFITERLMQKRMKQKTNRVISGLLVIALYAIFFALTSSGMLRRY